MSRHVRTTITIPPDLKARMEAAEQPVNWSAVAAEAFERKLSEFITQRGARNMSDVVNRLRASLIEDNSAEYQSGHEAGVAWATDQATARELKRLTKYQEQCGHEWDSLFDEDNGSAWTSYELLAFNMHPEIDGSREEAYAFFETVWGSHEAKSHQYQKGWAEGAISVWEEVKHQL